MKKFAIKGLIILGIVVILCVFLSGTLHTITTAKVRTVSARTGRFEEEITLTGNLQWPATVNLTVEGMTGEDTLVIGNIPVSTGAYVREGDVLAECTVSNYDSRLKTLQDTLAAREKEYLDQERKSGSLMITEPQQQWYTAYRQLQDARNTVQILRQDLALEAWKAGITPGEGDSLPVTCEHEALLEIHSRLTQAKEEEAAAESRFNQLSRLNISEEVISYLDKKNELQSEMDALNEEITALRILNERASAIRAPHAGYITAAELKAGDQVSKETVLITMTAPDTEPVIRLTQEDSKRTIDDGTAVTLSVGSKTTESVISKQGIGPDGSPYLDAAVSQKILAALGGAAAAAEEKAVTGKLICRAENPSSLIPVTALRGSGGNYYIYIANSAVDTLGAEQFTIARKDVTVLGINDTVASIEETLKNNTIVYLEDRQITDGCEVIVY